MFINPTFNLQAVGNLTSDPDVRFSDSGDKVANFTIAVNERWTNSDGEREERTYFVEASCWRGLADVVAQYLEKGDKVMLNGRPSPDSWVGDDGKTRNVLRIPSVADLKMLGSPNGKKRINDQEQEAEVEDDMPF